MKRSCGSCTKCCEGHLLGEVKGKPFFKGNPCHFLSIGTGCTIYGERPKDPCVVFKCGWLSSDEVPEWMKPDQINTIINFSFIKNIPYVELIESGSALRADVLTWFFNYAMKNNLNLKWQVNGGYHWVGTTEFSEEMKKEIGIQTG